MYSFPYFITCLLGMVVKINVSWIHPRYFVKGLYVIDLWSSYEYVRGMDWKHILYANGPVIYGHNTIMPRNMYK